MEEEGNEKREEEIGGIKGMARKLWMGKETDGWKERRIRREREVLEQEDGDGYAGLIGESLLEAFGGREKGEQEVDEKGGGE